MKKFFILLGVVLGNLVFAQTPQFIHYQAVIRDGNGAVLSNQTVSLKIEITQGQNTYTEIRTVNTNNVGLVNLSIGNLPAPNSIPFSSINWAGGSTSMLTWYDPTGSGSNWQYISSSDIASVPYALHAANVFSGDFNDLTNIPTIDSSNTNEIQTISAQGDTIYLSNGGQIYYGRFSGNFADLNGVPAIDTSYTNELQTIAMSGDTISLSNGGGSVVVNTFSGDFNDLSNVPNIDTSNTNELQVLSMYGDTLYLSNGGYVVLPISAKAEKIDDLTDGKVSGTSMGLGTGSLQALGSTTANNTAVGINSLTLNNAGGNNTALGSEALKNNLGGSQNTAVGQQAMLSNTGGDHNTALGTQSLRNNTSGNSNTAIGHDAMQTNTSGSENVAVGRNALKSSQYGSYNVAVGFNANSNNFSGEQNISIGNGAMALNTVGSVNTVVGRNALYNATNSNGTVAIGWEALYNSTTTYSNDAIGYRALKDLTVGGSNVAIGRGALQDLGSNSQSQQFGNTAVGHAVLNRMKSGSQNIALGDQVGAWLTGGSYNVIIGGAGAVSSDSIRAISNNTIVGYAAAGYIANGSNANTILGNEAFAAFKEGSQNIGIGWHAADGITKGGNNILIGGPNSGPQRVLPINSNVAIGMGSGSSLDSNAYANVFMGENAGNSMRGGSDNVAIGHAALQASPKGGYNVAVGTQAMQMSNVETSSNTAVGAQTLSNVRSNENTAVGKGALNQTTTGGSNTGLGVHALQNNTTGANNVAIGVSSLNNNTSGFSNTSLGTFSMTSNQTGQENVAIGFSSMAGNLSGSSNTAVGLYTLYGYQGMTGSFNTALGAHVLTNTISGQGNTGIGYWVFPNLNSGGYNIGIGNNVGSNVRDKSENILIGHEADVIDSLLSNSTAIGFGAIVRKSNSFQLGNLSTETVSTSGRYEGSGADLKDSSITGDNAILRLSSNTKGFIFPTMSYVERQNVIPEIGMAIYCKDCGANGQLQIFNGSIWTDFSGNNALGMPLSVGDTAFGGIVAYILSPQDSGYNSSQQHGIIISQNDLAYGLQWGCMSLVSSSEKLFMGEYNLQNFLSQCPNSPPNRAMLSVSNFSQNGYSDWVMPTKNDLLAIYQNMNSLTTYFQSGTYWSSTNNSNGAGAWNVNLYTGLVGTFLKNDTYHRTKPIRYF